GIQREDLCAAAVASVVPELKNTLEHAVYSHLNQIPYFADGSAKTGISIEPQRLRSFGIDRLADLEAARRDYGGPLLVIDFGTAITYDVLTETGVSLGGAISPGIQICAEALWEKAAQLPRFSIQRPEALLAKSTVDSMRSGLIFGCAGQVEYFVRECKKLFQTDLTVIATGGCSVLLRGITDAIDIYDENLTLKGIRYLYDRNHPKN
ncbi:MAG: type III pantothenate kinase, partial [Oscillospiraceae bacterium]|nr:type III pantothenate kinase [Oscillospiraceae bacterium]